MPKCDPFIYLLDDDSCNLEAHCDAACINSEQPPVEMHTDGTPHWDNLLAGDIILEKYLKIFDDEIDLWSPLPCNLARGNFD
jgi:hypothetical protein